MQSNSAATGTKFIDAFHGWFWTTFHDDIEGGAAYLFDCLRSADSDSIVWGILEEVGDRAYTPETFLKASQLVVDRAKQEA